MFRIPKPFLAVVLAGGSVMAQPAAPPAPPADPATPPPAAADVPVRQQATLSAPEMLEQAREYRTRIDGIRKQVEGDVAKARTQKDIIRLNCLLDKLAQIKANLQIADQGLQTLQEAAARRDDGAAFHEHARITLVNQRVLLLGAEAQGCIGEDLSFIGKTRVDVEVEGVPPEDFTQPSGPQLAMVRPPAASPFK